MHFALCDSGKAIVVELLKIGFVFLVIIGLTLVLYTSLETGFELTIRGVA